MIQVVRAVQMQLVLQAIEQFAKPLALARLRRGAQWHEPSPPLAGRD